MNLEISNFLKNTEWHTAKIEWFGADWSVRDYGRLTKDDGRTAILLKSPPDDSPDAREGHMIGEWVRIQNHFKSLGLNVPEIFNQDLSAGFILMQDFGTEIISSKGIDAYLKATDILIHMLDHPKALSIPLKKYEETHVYRALRFFPEYVLDGTTTEWFAVWKDIESALPPCPRALTHIDFAAMNLMWNDGNIGIIDFQAACDAPFVYDLINLLEDIRRDVPQNIKTACINHYCAALSPETRGIFNQWYLVITAQFHARILGQIQFLKQTQGRDDLMQYYAPLMKRFEKQLENDYLSPIREYIHRHCEGTK